MKKAFIPTTLAFSLIAGCSTHPKSQMIKAIETPEDRPVFIAQHPGLGRIELIVSERVDDYNENRMFDYPEEFEGIQRKFVYKTPVTITFSVENPSKDIKYFLFSPKSGFEEEKASSDSQISEKYYPLEIGTYFIETYHGNEKLLADWFEVTPRWMNSER